MNTFSNFEALPVRTSADLEKFAEVGANGCALADLTLGSWAPQSLASQLLSQLVGRAVSPAREESPASRSLSDAMSAGIDLEGKGNGVLLEAASVAAQIARLSSQRALPLGVLVPAFGLEWRVADHLLLEYLLALHPEVKIRLGIIEAVAPPEEELPLVAKLPTVIAPAIRNSLEETAKACLLILPNGWAIVRPEYRRFPVSFREAEIQLLRQGAVRAFSAYACLHAEDSFAADPWQFCVEAWSQFGSGYRELATRYIDEALTRARNAQERHTFLCHRQSMRLAMARYADASAETIPDPAETPEAVLGFLLETKGWGLVMSNNPKPALPLLHEALALLKRQTLDVPYLFLMNITALAEVRSGNLNTALQLEQEIETAIEAGVVSDARLTFVNSLNLARLYRYVGDLTSAESYYKKAFQTFEGGRTMTDSVNANLCLARVYEGRGESEKMFACWLRAALHWMASSLPESLNWRVQSLVFGKAASPEIASRTAAVHLVEQLASSFLDGLRRYSAPAVATAEFQPGQALTSFALTDQVTVVTQDLYAVGAAGWGVLCGAGPTRPNVYGPKYAELNRWLSAFIQLNAQVQKSANCIYLYTRDGGEMPQTWEELSDSGTEFGVRRFVFEGREEESKETERFRVAERNPLISIMAEADNGALQVSFRRYLQPTRLIGPERRLFQALDEHSRVSSAAAALHTEGWSEAQVEQGIATLRKRRVIRVRRPLLQRESATA